MTQYHYKNRVYYSFADLVNAYYKDNGFYPAKAYKTVGIYNLFYK